MADKPFHVQLVIASGCQHCEGVKKILSEVKTQYPALQVEEIDATTSQGMELAAKHSILASPGVLLNGELFSIGGINKGKFIQKLNSLK